MAYHASTALTPGVSAIPTFIRPSFSPDRTQPMAGAVSVLPSSLRPGPFPLLASFEISIELGSMSAQIHHVAYRVFFVSALLLSLFSHSAGSIHLDFPHWLSRARSQSALLCSVPCSWLFPLVPLMIGFTRVFWFLFVDQARPPSPRLLPSQHPRDTRN